MRTETHEDQATGDIYQLLKRDHESVSQLLDEIEGTEESDPRRRQALFERLVVLIEAHSQAEEDTFYSVLEQYDDLADRVDEGRQEHDDIDQSLEELDELSVGDPDWIDKMHELRQIFQRHVEEEEGEIFPRARRHIGPEEAVHLAR
ncbi:MAG TPA: hemerythrin domain-containing protein, partial [Kofleriaceae bacterium]|nr:hemerythrin domain-containing protein [Kofleriaceae bacterium]